jgi:endonuclease G
VANEQTFYGTNIAPQLNGHNTSIWKALEDKARSIASAADTLYVVTGCIVEGATEYSTDTSGKKITIPVAFYKAWLRYKADGGNDKWIAAGFYTEHKKYTNNDLSAVAMSIDELEQKTGFDFFVNLKDEIGAEAAAAVEAQDPTKNAVWGL